MKQSNLNQKINQIANSVSTDPYFYWITFLKYKKQLLLIPLMVSLLSLFISKNIQPVYQSTATLILENKENNIINIEQVYSELPQANRNQYFINTQKEILASNEILIRLFQKENNIEKALQYNQINEPTLLTRIFYKDQKIDEEDLKKYIKNNLTISSSRDNNVITLKFDSQSQEFSKFFLDELITTYLEYDIDQKISVTTYANMKIKERLDELKNELENSERKLQSYKQENKLIDLGDIKNLKNEEIRSISSRILKAEKELQTLQNDLQQISLTSDDIEELSALKIIKDQKEVSQILSNLDTNSNTIDSLKLVYKENHPKLEKALKTEINLKEKLNKIVEENITSMAYEIANLQSFIELSEDQLEISRQELEDLEIKDIDMQKYSREVDLNKRIYESFLERLKETSEAKELQTPSANILDKPNYPLIPISPNVKTNTLISFVITFIFLYGLITYYETFRNSINGPEELEQNDFEVLSIIPKTNTKKGYHLPINFLEKNSDKFTESILTFQTILLSKYRTSKVFMLTSPVSGEGKTTISLNLALSLATKNKVLFLETDFRRPSLLKSLNFQHKDGLIELFNDQTEFSKIKFNIYSTKLDIIPAGKPSNFNKSIDRDKLKNFIEILKSKYDYIIIDTAPILPIADTLSIAEIVDNTILVVRSGYTKINGLINANNKLSMINDKKISTVLNYFDTDNINYYNYSNYGSYYKNYYDYSVG